MPRRKSDTPLTKHTLNLYEGDYDRLVRIYGSAIGGARVIRELVRRHLNEAEAKLPKPPTVSEVDIEIP